MILSRPRAPLRFWLGSGLAVAVACGSTNREPPTPPTGTAPASPATTAPASPTSSAPEAAPPPLDPSPPPVLGAWAERRRDGLWLHVANRGAEPAALRAEVAVEGRSGDGWARIGTPLVLRVDCEGERARCLTLAPGAELVVPAWTEEEDGGRRCGCEPCAQPPPEELRFVIESCAPDGHRPHAITSPPATP